MKLYPTHVNSPTQTGLSVPMGTSRAKFNTVAPANTTIGSGICVCVGGGGGGGEGGYLTLKCFHHL